MLFVQAVSFFGPEEKQQQEMFCRWARAFPISMMVHLRAGEDLRKELKVMVVARCNTTQSFR
jgi:hypothetical protein